MAYILMDFEVGLLVTTIATSYTHAQQAPSQLIVTVDISYM